MKPAKPNAPNGASFAIVGLGASAGGLEALQQFLAALEAKSGMAFVVVTHQHPDAATLLPELLAKHSPVRVSTIAQGERPEPNRVYVAPPGPNVSLVDGRFQFEANRQNLGSPLPIDHFFRSLARACGRDAIGIVLSGTGSDGTLGVSEIKAAGGFAFAQDPESARFSGMPVSAAATHAVDGVLPPNRMPRELGRLLARRAGTLALPDEKQQAAVQRLLHLLRARTGHDFSSYKKSTLHRRIERRMNVRGVTEVAEYCRLLEENQSEAETLFRELLISVTGFFRDPEVFASLRAELRGLLEAHDDKQPFRAWIPACATGEEAYTIAILVRELLEELGKNVQIQIFATDLDQHAVDSARAGRYPSGIAADVGQERLDLYFSKQDDEYRIKKEIRDIIVFAAQNVIKDPPFTRLDLVSCRNLLIYLEPDLQRRVLALFSYALKPGGLLLLGNSESISGQEEAFVAVDKKSKLFRRERLRIDPPAEFPDAPSVAVQAQASRPRFAGKDVVGLGHLVERVLLSKLAPPSVLVTGRGEIRYFHGRTGDFLEPSAGEPGANVFQMAREGLRLELPAALRVARSRSEPVVRAGLMVKGSNGSARVRLTVRKLEEPEMVRDMFLVTFELEPEPSKGQKAQSERARGPDLDRIRELELELQHTRENLQGTIEELETSNEELKSTNEELQSTNEELQSANEELETSREEMQSLNEELQTVNSELEERNNALSQTNDDMQNLLNSTDIATVFLDDKLAIKRFTTQARKVFSLIDTDIGRPISDLTANVRYESLVEDAREVLQSLVFREREIQTKEGAWRLMRIMPYRTAENLIDGLVMTFIDIDRIKRNEGEAERARRFHLETLSALRSGIAVLGGDLRILSANPAFYELLHTTEKRSIGERLLADHVLEAPDLAAELARVRSEGAELRGFRVLAGNQRVDKDLLIHARTFKATGHAEPVILLTVEDALPP